MIGKYKLGSWLFAFALLALAIWLPANLRNIQDWIFLQTYEPTIEIVELAHDAKLSDKGREIYYVSDPQLQDKITFASSCDFAEFNIVVGCYDGRRIYILDIENPELEPGELVTAAHETLHAVYDRLSDSQRKDIDAMLLAQADTITDPDILETMALYKEQSPETYTNELHSIFGTEVLELSDELNRYYDQYFTNRAEVVRIAQEYDKIFSELEDEAKELAEKLNKLADSLNSSGRQLKDWFEELDILRNSLQTRIDSGEYSSSLINNINDFEQQVKQYNLDVATYRLGIKEYNKLKLRYDSIALRHENLVNSIDSGFTPEGIKE